MGWLFQLFVTPALVSLAVSLWAGRVMDAQRARRDNLTKLFETSREDVRRAIDAGVEYFAAAPGDRTALQEAKVVGADRDLRHAIPMVLGEIGTVECAAARSSANEAFYALIAELTGGNFQAAEGETDREHIRRLVHAGARMRASLAKLRDAQLYETAKRDFILQQVDRGRTWWREKGPYRLPPPP